MNIYPICDSISEIGAAQIRSVTEIAPKSSFLYAKEKALYGMVFVQAQKHLVWFENSLRLQENIQK